MVFNEFLKFVYQFVLIQLDHEGNQNFVQPTCHMRIAYVKTVELLEQSQRLVELLPRKYLILGSIGECSLDYVVDLLRR